MKLKNLSHEEFIVQLNNLDVCQDGIDYIIEHKYDLKTFWNECDNFSYLYWYAREAGVNINEIKWSALKNARLVAHIDKSGSALKAIEIAEKYLKKESAVTKEMVTHAAYASEAAACDSGYASMAAAYAAYAAYASMAALYASAAKNATRSEVYKNVRDLIEIDN